MANDVITLADVLLVTLPSNSPTGYEQEGVRPAVVVGVPRNPVRYPVVIVVPLTTQTGPWADRNPILYPRILPGTGGLARASIVLLDQVRSVDARRVTAYLGTLKAEAFTPIQNGLFRLFR